MTNKDVPAPVLELPVPELPVPEQASTAPATFYLDPDESGSVLKRLKRARGQLGGIIRMIEAGRDCTEIITQMAAVSKALDRVGLAVIAAGLKQCVAEDPAGERVDTLSLEKLFLSLA